ncbi:MAG TPA: extracellular solute-binding protein [Fibrobacteria bacterium]|nr:extracellular solute-binding protein [Fibrobacteria bacterium]
MPKMTLKSAAFFLALAAALTASGCRQQDRKGGARATVQEQKAAVDTSGEADPNASPEAVKGGTFTSWAGGFPKSLNMWLEYNSFLKDINELMFEPLVDLHATENRWVGVLADSWTVSGDQKVFTFHIDPRARWSDGVPVTAADVLFFYDTMMNPKNLTSLFRVGLSRFNRPVVKDSLTLELTAKTVHWANFVEAGNTMTALPKHVWEGKDFNTLNFEIPVVSGPYKLLEVKKDRSLTLQRRADWWGRVRKYNQNKYNFDYLKYRFMEDQAKVLETFKKGELDFTQIGTAAIWAEKTHFDQVMKGYVVRRRIFNPQPKSFAGFAFNLRRPQFQDVRVREALCYLINRPLINEKLMFNQYVLLNSYFPDLYPGNVNPAVPVRPYDPAKARDLLAQAGWKPGADGLLAKDGKPFQAVFLTASPDMRHLNVVVEDLKSVGIKAGIDLISYSTLAKRMDNHEFDLYWVTWQATRLRDPEAEWVSTTADDISTNNYPGVKDKVVDSLINLQKTEMDLEKRNRILVELDARLNRIIPYALLWNADNDRILYWNRYGTPKSVYDKYRDSRCIPIYWWEDPAKAKILKEAMAGGKSLPVIDGDVHYQE